MFLKKYAEYIFLSIIAVFAPIQQTLAAVAVLILIDMITGMVAAHKRGEKLSSAEMRRSVSKVIAYEASIAAAFLAEKYIIGDIIPATKLVATICGSVELKSILENSDILSGGSLFKSIVDKLGSSNQDKSN